MTKIDGVFFQVIPLLSLAIVIVGALHLGDCQVQPLLPIWHIVAGASGLCTPFFYLLFDDVSPWLTRRFPGISDFIDNAVVCILPIYIVFEVAWLITGKVKTSFFLHIFFRKLLQARR